MMKTFKYGKMSGVGLGAGLAIVAVYSFTTTSPPGSFQPLDGEFRSLADLEAKMEINHGMKPSPGMPYALESGLASGPESEVLFPVSNSPALDLPTLELNSPTHNARDSKVFPEHKIQVKTAQHQPLETIVTTDSDESLDALFVMLDSDQEDSNAPQATAQLESRTAETGAMNIDEFVGFDNPSWDSITASEELSVAAELAPAGTLNDTSDNSIGINKIETAPLAVVKPNVKTPANEPSSAGDSDPNARQSWTKNPFLLNNEKAIRTINNAMKSEISATAEISSEISQLALQLDSEATDSVTLEMPSGKTVAHHESSVIDFRTEGPARHESAFDTESAVTDVSQTESEATSLAAVVARPIQFSNSAISPPAAIPDLSIPQSDTTDPYDVAPINTRLSESVAQRAAQHIEYGKTLARRGASFAAKQEFYSALQVLAHANDEKTGINEFSLSLRRAIIALKEAEDFMVTDTETQIGLNVGLTAETHRCGVLTKEEAALLSPVEAMQRYFGEAQTQLQRAVGSNVVSAEALYCLGKLHTVVAQSSPTAGRLEIAKAIVYHRAALTSDIKNHRSANELGVLLARSGQLAEARDLFKESLRVQPVPQTWENLAKIHQRLNEPQLAQLATVEFHRSAQMQSMGGGEIQWKPTGQFNADAPLEFHEAIAAKPAAPIQTTAEKINSEKPGSEDKSKSFGEKIKDFF